MKKALPIVTVLLPLIIFTAWVSKYFILSRNGIAVRLAVTGYDPRDLLAGHYLRYTVNYGGTPICQEQNIVKTVCVCLDQIDANGISSISWAGNCKERPQCKNWLSGQCLWSRFDARIDRYYFPEKFTNSLTTVPSDASIEVRLDGLGNGVVSGFFIKDVPLLEYLKANQS